jgi:hypothetical protein
MSNIHSILPLLEDDSWRWDKPEINQKTLAPGNSEPLFQDPTYPGFVYFATLGVRGNNAENAEIQFDFDRFETNRSYKDLFRVGLTGSGGISPSITRYDTDDDVYAARIAPNIPISYLDNASLEVRAPNTDEIVVDGLGLNLNVVDMERFMFSFQRATRGEVIDGFDRMIERLDRLNSNMEIMMQQLSDIELDRPEMSERNSPDRDNLEWLDDLV